MCDSLDDGRRGDNYRIIDVIHDDVLLITVVTVGQSKKIYDR